jgi:sporulation protein YlmC with PRC-barrel domain
MMVQRFVTTTAIAAALALSGAAAMAQPAAAPSTSPPAASAAPHTALPAASQPARHMREDQMRATKLVGSTVYDPSDQKIGSIADLVLDRDGKVADVIIAAGEKHVGVPMTDLKRGKDNHFVLNITKDALKQMANFDLNQDEAAHSGSSTHK